MAFNDLNRYRKVYPFYRTPGVEPLPCCDLVITDTKTTNYDANYDEFVKVDPSGGPLTINLPSAVGNKTKVIYVKNVTSSTTTITVDASGSETIDGSATYSLSADHGSVGFVSDGVGWLVVFDESTGGGGGGGGGGGNEFFYSTTNASIYTTGSAAFRGSESIDSPVDKGSDVFFYVSGSGGSKGTSTKGVSLFGGDVVISGTLHGGSPLKIGSDVNLTGSLSIGDGSIKQAHVIGSTGEVLGQSAKFGHDGTIGEVVVYYTDGVIEQTGLHGNGDIVGQVLKLGTTGGGCEIQMSSNGSIQTINAIGQTAQLKINDLSGAEKIVLKGDPGQITASLGYFTQGISGSLTKLANGTSYLIGGSGISITSSSNGSVTVSSQLGTSGSWWSGAAVGSNNQVLTSDGSGGIIAEGNLTFDGSNLNVTGNAIVSGDLTVNGTTTTINTTNLEVKDSVIGLGFSSGTVALAAGDRGWIGGIASANNVMMKWDNTAQEFMVGRTTSSATGSFGVSSYSGFRAANILGTVITASSGFTGSLTRLTNGASYIEAGPGIVIATSSLGQVSISSSLGTSGSWWSGAAVGINNNVLTSDGSGGIVAESNLNFNGTRLEITGSVSQGGTNNKATGLNSHAEGLQSTSEGFYSHAEGRGGYALGNYSHAEGYFVTGSGDYSHAEGFQTKTFGDYSHAEGFQTITSGTYSHAEGIGTIASGSGQTVVGSYNLRGNTTSLFVVGDGTGDTDANRSDVLRVETNMVQVTGTLHAGRAFVSSSVRIGTDTFGGQYNTSFMVSDDNFYYLCNPSTANFTASLPLADDRKGAVFTIKNFSTTRTVLISSSLGDNIDNVAGAVTLGTDKASVIILSSGVNWWIIGSHGTVTGP